MTLTREQEEAIIAYIIDYTNEHRCQPGILKIKAEHGGSQETIKRLKSIAHDRMRSPPEQPTISPVRYRYLTQADLDYLATRGIKKEVWDKLKGLATPER